MKLVRTRLPHAQRNSRTVSQSDRHPLQTLRADAKRASPRFVATGAAD